MSDDWWGRVRGVGSETWKGFVFPWRTARGNNGAEKSHLKLAKLSAIDMYYNQ